MIKWIYGDIDSGSTVILCRYYEFLVSY